MCVVNVKVEYGWEHWLDITKQLSKTRVVFLF